jgi:hypothetical protein
VAAAEFITEPTLEQILETDRLARVFVAEHTTQA